MSDTKENNVLVIGNGFDLYHGLKTRYFDFVEFTKHKSDLKNPFIKFFQQVVEANDGWIDCEDTVYRIVKFFNNILNNNSAELIKGFSTKELSKENIEIIRAFENYFVRSELPFSAIRITNEFRNGFDEFDKKKFLDDLRRELDDTIRILWHYLKIDMEEIKYDKYSEQIRKIEQAYVVNFNYTNTITKLYHIDKDDVFYIHGDLANESKNMVFGIPDDEEDNLDFVYFKKYFQRIQKRTGILDNEKIHKNKYQMGINCPVHSYFFGHSLSITDGDIIEEIFKLSRRVTIYYLDQSDYESKVINLLKIFGKEMGTNMIQTGKIEFIKIEDPVLV